ncbi:MULTISPECIES: alpha/beta hydrolase family protein [unclassified Leifsonia]|uniref:alpha/beta hydrolase family protein n=1 Tax=unclassified Leifsonia TaxID=2663824 RepID=UPI0006F8410A|nr:MULTISPECIES: alpha/beta family hydrolase [unclassified Leifsonia]KQX08097.1 dienelactone hydrolase [Leifsonia sp. Root1293]KRA12378.1 dienelactone hydrolase [Leifsonia sp. Root60]
MSTEPITIDIDGTTVSGAYARPESAWATVVVAHGAGSGYEHPFLVGFAEALAAEGVATLRFNFAYREAGRSFPDRPPAAIAAWRAALTFAQQRARDAASPDEPVWAAGKSFGGRMASMAVAEGMEPAGLVFLGYPLHPPGRPEKIRDAHLYGLTLPMLFVEGTRDPFIGVDLLESVVERIGRNASISWIDGGTHDFAVAGTKRPADVIGASLATIVADYMRAQA